jgi:protein-L-isoaspartate(D-aspartate) O-methyltransferase
MPGTFAQEVFMLSSSGVFQRSLLQAVLLALVVLISGCRQEGSYQVLRERMVERQILARGIADQAVLDAMRRVPRHEFVPEDLRHAAYEDHPLPIGEGQTISQPYIVALMTEVLHLLPGERVLEIGTGSGYQAAVLAELTDQVYTIEILEDLGKRGEETLQRLGYSRVRVKIGDGYLGWEEHAPYDAIMVTCAPDHIPQPLVDQLVEGGRMVIPVGRGYRQELYLVEKQEGQIRQTDIIPVLFVPMTGEHGVP